MNIFKMLTRGYGKIDENNISSFLGSLLVSNDEFREKFLKEIESEIDVNKYKFKILYEQKFYHEDSSLKKSDKIDIVLIASEEEIEFDCETSTSALRYLISEGKKTQIKKVFLIENKIYDDSTTSGQLLNQYKVVNKFIEDENKGDSIDLYSIYVTPEGEKSEKEFEKFKNSNEINSKIKHLFWNKEMTEILSSMFKNDIIIEHFTAFINEKFSNKQSEQVNCRKEKQIEMLYKGLEPFLNKKKENKLIGSFYQKSDSKEIRIEINYKGIMIYLKGSDEKVQFQFRKSKDENRFNDFCSNKNINIHGGTYAWLKGKGRPKDSFPYNNIYIIKKELDIYLKEIESFDLKHPQP